MKKINHCIDCGKLIWQLSIRCKSCARKYQYTTKPETYWRFGFVKKVTYCDKCGKKLSHFRFHLCRSCSLIGHKISDVTKEKMRLNHANFKGKNSPNFGKLPSHGKRIKYKKYCFRSSWEAKYAKWLDKNKISWLYEPKTFDLKICSYTPDFYLPQTNEYIEIKGWWRDNAKLKFNLFKKMYRSIKISILMKKQLKTLNLI